MNQNSDAEWDDPSLKEFGDLQKYAYVTNKAWDNNHVGYCYREYSDIKIDSGWRFLLGDETEDYLDNPDNSQTLDLSEIVKWNPKLATIISSRYNSEFEWDEKSDSYLPI